MVVVNLSRWMLRSQALANVLETHDGCIVPAPMLQSAGFVLLLLTLRKRRQIPLL
jgi:hypothetical protein